MARRFTLEKPGPEDGESPLLDALNPRQKEAARHVDGPLLILAGAGSGKTRVMTHRIAYLISEVGVHPQQILAMTFTNKAAGEMRDRVDELLGEERSAEARRITISTFHSMCARLLRIHAEDLGLTSHFVIYDQDDQLALIKNVMEAEGRGKDRTEARRLRGFIERMKNGARTPEQAHELAYSQQAEDDAQFYEIYQGTLRDANCVDFGDLILGVLQLFRADPELAKSYSIQWRYVMVDEFQDTNPAQYELLEHLTAAHDNLAVVGDDDQSIYRWRGATVSNILDFEDDFSGTTVVKLEQNYRSSQRILDAAHDVIELNSQRRDKKLWTERGEGAPITVFTATDDREEATWVAERINEMVRRDGKDYRDFAVFYRTNAQARAFEEQMRYQGVPYQIVGGLSFYARAEIKDILAYLKVALNPANEVDLLRVINTPSRSVGKKTIEKLTVAGALPHVEGIWGAVCYVADEGGAPQENREIPPGWLPGIDPGAGGFDTDNIDPELQELDDLNSRSAGGVRKFYDLIESIRDDLAHHEGLVEVVRGLIERIGYFDHLESKDPERAEDKKRNVAELVNAIGEFEQEFRPDEDPVDSLDVAEGARLYRDGARAVAILRAFLDQSALLASTDRLDETTGAVTLMTVHGSKGLEFDTVFLSGMEDEIFPSLREDHPEELEEERRLAYVAITRAERKLFITNARRRRVYGRFKNTTPSRFVLDIDPDRIEVAPRSTARSVDYRGYGRRSRRGSGRRGSGGRGNLRPFGKGVDSSEWEFDQSPQMIRHNVKKQNAKDSEDPEWDEFSQVPPSTDEEGGDALKKSKEPYEGCTISHTKFGVGSVSNISGSGDKAVLTIDFPSVGTKKIVRKFVKVLG